MINIIYSKPFLDAENFFYKPYDILNKHRVLHIEDFIRDNYDYRYVNYADINYNEKNYIFFSICDPADYNSVNVKTIKNLIPDHYNLHICISFPMECFIPDGVKQFMDHLLYLYPKANFYFSHANSIEKDFKDYPEFKKRVNEYCKYEDWCRVKHIPYPFFELLYYEFISNSYLESQPHSSTLHKKFLMPINVAKSWRIMFYLWCRDNNILSNSYYSWTGTALGHYLKQCEQDYDYPKLPLWKHLDTEDYEFLKEQILLDPNDTRVFNDRQWLIPDECYTTSFSQIILETTFDNRSNLLGETIFLTEKTYKAIFYEQPFILVSEPGSLEYLKNLGYLTFDKVIDESYDRELNYHKRMELITNEIKKINNMTYDELTHYRNVLLDVTKHNKKHFSTLPTKKRIINTFNRMLFNE